MLPAGSSFTARGATAQSATHTTLGSTTTPGETQTYWLPVTAGTAYNSAGNVVATSGNTPTSTDVYGGPNVRRAQMRTQSSGSIYYS